MPKKLRILFVIQSASIFHYYESIIKALSLHGHRVKVLFDKELSQNFSLEPVKLLQKEVGFEYDWLQRRSDIWRNLIFSTREILSHRRHLKINSLPYRNWRRYTPLWFRVLTKIPGFNLVIESDAFGRILLWFENFVPADKKIVDYIHEYNPDAVVAAPVNLQQAEEAEYLKAAKSLNIPTVLPVLSWDNLSTKGFIHIIPDRLLVWNSIHLQEAQYHQRIPLDKIRIIGSPFFDVWFSGFKPSGTRKNFCSLHGLDENNLIILYLGSSRNIAHDETWLIKDLRSTLDDSGDERMRRAQIIVRPHGANFKIFDQLNLKNTIVLPKKGTLPDTLEAQQLFYDTLFNCDIVVGINTSAMIDAVINKKPVIVILPDMYSTTQIDLSYFKNLLNSGAVESVKTPEEFVASFKKILEGVDSRKNEREAFVKKFIRPRDMAVSAGEFGAQEIEKLAEEFTR